MLGKTKSKVLTVAIISVQVSFFFVMILFYPGQFSNKDVCSTSLSRQKVVNLLHSLLCFIQIYTIQLSSVIIYRPWTLQLEPYEE